MVAVLPSTTVVCCVSVAAPALPAKATRSASRLASTAACRNLDIFVCSSRWKPARPGQVCHQTGKSCLVAVMWGADGDGVADLAHAFEAERQPGAVGEVEVVALRVGATIDHPRDQHVAVVDDLDGRP